MSGGIACIMCTESGLACFSMNISNEIVYNNGTNLGTRDPHSKISVNTN